MTTIAPGCCGLPVAQLLGGDRVGQRAAGVEIGDQHALVRAQDRGGLGHEVHAAEDDRVGVGRRPPAGRGRASRRRSRRRPGSRAAGSCGRGSPRPRSRASARTSSWRAGMFSSSSGASVGAEHRQVHGSGSRMRERSRAGALWVSAPTETKSTPVLAISRSVSSVTPPLASSSARPPTCAHRVAQLLGRSCCRAGSGARPAPSASSTSASVRHSTSSGARARARGPGRTASPTPPAIAAWFSLIRIASYRPARWFVPPPAATAAFSSVRRPGRRLARVEDPCAGAVDRLDAAGRHRRHAGQPLQEVQRGALGGQDRARRPLERAAPARRSRHAPRSTSRSQRDVRVQRPERLLGELEPEHHARRLLRDQRLRPRRRGNGRRRGHVAVADILGQRAGDDI